MKATLIHHQGFGDLFTSNALCNYYAKALEELIIFAFDNQRFEIMKKMYKHLDNVKIIVPEYTTTKTGDSCIQCHTDCFEHNCPRGPYPTCQYIDYSNYSEYKNIKIGCFGGFDEWLKFLSKEKSFSHAFYNYAEIDINTRIDMFKIDRDENEENSIFNTFEYFDKEYIVIHDDSKRSLNIDRTHIPTGLPLYQLDSQSKTMLDQLKIIENAKEIHLIDSSYSVLVYYLSFYSEKIKNTPKYIHSYMNRNRDYNIYVEPTPENWYII